MRPMQRTYVPSYCCMAVLGTANHTLIVHIRCTIVHSTIVTLPRHPFTSTVKHIEESPAINRPQLSTTLSTTALSIPHCIIISCHITIMSKAKYTIPAEYFIVGEVTNYLLRKHRASEFQHPESFALLSEIFRRLAENMRNIKSRLRLDPDSCVKFLIFTSGRDDHKFNTEVAHLELKKSIISDEEQTSAIGDLIRSLKVVRGFIKEDNRYIQVPEDTCSHDKDLLIKTASLTAHEVSSGMIDFISAISDGAGLYRRVVN